MHVFGDDSMRMLLPHLCVLACGVPATVGQDQSTPADSAPLVELTEKNFAAWRDHLLPSAKDVAWERIPWLASLAEGVVAAAVDDERAPARVYVRKWRRWPAVRLV